MTSLFGSKRAPRAEKGSASENYLDCLNQMRVFSTAAQGKTPFPSLMSITGWKKCFHLIPPPPSSLSPAVAEAVRALLHMQVDFPHTHVCILTLLCVSCEPLLNREWAQESSPTTNVNLVFATDPGSPGTLGSKHRFLPTI